MKYDFFKYYFYIKVLLAYTSVRIIYHLCVMFKKKMDKDHNIRDYIVVMRVNYVWFVFE